MAHLADGAWNWPIGCETNGADFSLISEIL
jgi:hypothetical protein